MVTIDSYPEANYSTAMNIRRVHPTAEARASAAGQCFAVPAGNDYRLASCRFYLRKQGLPVGIMNANLYALAGVFGVSGLPAGASLAVSDNVTMEGVPVAYTVITFTFSGANRYLLRGGTNYCIALVMTSATTLDDANYIIFGADDTAPTHAGNYFYWSASAWIANATWDGLFYVDGDNVPKVGTNSAKARLLNIVAMNRLPRPLSQQPFFHSQRAKLTMPDLFLQRSP